MTCHYFAEQNIFKQQTTHLKRLHIFLERCEVPHKPIYHLVHLRLRERRISIEAQIDVESRDGDVGIESEVPAKTVVGRVRQPEGRRLSETTVENAYVLRWVAKSTEPALRVGVFEECSICKVWCVCKWIATRYH